MGESDSQGDVSRSGVRAKSQEQGVGVGRKGKAVATVELIQFTERCLSTNGRQLGIMIGQSCISQSGKSIKLKPEPVAAVKSVRNRKDVLVLLPTCF